MTHSLRLAALVVAVSLGLSAASRTEAQMDDMSTDAAVARIFDKRCVRCHGPKKQRGRLRLDTVAGVQKAVTPGSPQDSELLRRVSLDEDHEDAMPPIGRRLKPSEIEVIEAWIEAGAPTDAFDSTARPKAEPSQDKLLLAQLKRTSGAKVTALDGEGKRLRVDFSLNRSLVPSRNLRALSRASERIVELSLAGHPVSSAALNLLPDMPNLERLHLERTTLDDSGMDRLVQRAPHVRYLNLHSTNVTNQALTAFERLDHLQRLVLYGTGVDKAGLERFRSLRPDVHVTGTLALPDEPYGELEPRRILAADASKRRIALLRETAIGRYDVLWEHPIEEIHDLQVLENGNLLFQETWTRLVEVDPRKKETVWSYEARERHRSTPEEPVEIHAFRRLPDNVTMIAESGPARILEVDIAGNILVNVPLQIDDPQVHHDTRLVRKPPVGTYLGAHEADGAVREYDASGSVVWFYDVPLFGREHAGGHGLDGWGNQVFSAERLPGGNTLIATGNGHSVLEVNPTGEIVWHLAQDDIEGVRLAWVTTLQTLDNGHLILGNCHAGSDQPQLVEITRDKKLVWRFHDFERFGNSLSNAWVIEDRYIRPGEPIPTGREKN